MELDAMEDRYHSIRGGHPDSRAGLRPWKSTADEKEHRWGVILAGGDGVRLRPVTRMVARDGRPKQFCPLLGGKTLLERTRERIARGIARDRTMFVLLKAHETYYPEELADVPSPPMVVHPSHRE